MRRPVVVGVVAGALLAVCGCSGGEGSLETGVPKNVDMSKDYSPPVPLPTMGPKDKAKAAARAKSGEEAPKIEDLPGAKKK